MSQQEIKELSALPLELLISTPLNAAVKAQQSSALTTANFVRDIGFTKPGLFKKPDSNEVSDVRVAAIKYKVKEVQQKPGVTPPTFEAKEVTRDLQVPYLSLVTVPNLEIGEVSIDFNVRLESVRSQEMDFSLDNTTTETGTLSAGLDGASLGIPVSVGGSMTVQSTTQTKFGARYGEGHTSEYNLHITVKATQATPPKGIEKLLALAEKIVDSSERADAEARRLTAQAATPAPSPAPAPAPLPAPTPP